jgi:hypothetical protein
MLEFETTYDKVRVYFNSRAAGPYYWSIDTGDQVNELFATSVVGQGVHRFEYNGQEPNPNHPVAWIEYRDARVHRIDKDGDEFFVENDSGY